MVLEPEHGKLSDWKALALHYGTAERPLSDLQLEVPDIHDRVGRIEYFVWLLRHQGRLILVDTGFSAEEGRARGRAMLIHPVDALARLGIGASDITDVVITHLHYDHAGNLGDFPNARFHIQDREMAYGTGRCMCHRHMRKPFAAEAVVDAVRLVFKDRMYFHDGDAELSPGLSLHLIGGHSKGLQVVRLVADGKTVVVASDALHFEHYLDDKNAFPLYADYLEVVEGYRRLVELAGPNGVLIAGHDPKVLSNFQPLSPEQPFSRVLL
jgi:glyoxylase-like metal-dependent hydrolase (beta-lactamase superfamily II)